MTEHSKIPLPSGPGKGKSLFERAEDLFGFDAFAPAPPAELAGPAAVQPVRQAPPTAPDPEPADVSGKADEPGQAPQPAVPEAVSTAAVATAAPEAAEETIRFTGTPQRINRQHLADQALIQLDGRVTTLLEEFRIVKRQLLLAARAGRRNGGGASAQRVLVCSPLPGEGKTFCATNLALTMAAEKDGEVLLVDADFAKPSVLSALGLSGGRGLMDALADPSIPIEECVIATDIPGLYVLPAGNQTSSDSEYLSSAHTGDVLDRLTQGAPNRMVIFDSPPALAASPAAELAKYVGQALVVARADITGQSALEDALSLLSACPDIKLLLNAAHFSPSGRRFGSYYGYGE
ncbi:MAG TPA: AAA family ATPase [Croceibacterium sp.]|jgi:Mrp family chromosome partitioning ATPase